MARFYIFNCLACDTITTERIEYTPPSNSRPANMGRHVIDLNQPADHEGYPSKSILCTHCNLPVIGYAEPPVAEKKVPPVYFNYMGDD